MATTRREVAELRVERANIMARRCREMGNERAARDWCQEAKTQQALINAIDNHPAGSARRPHQTHQTQEV